MAGSIKHVLKEDRRTYRGFSLLENYRDTIEAVEEFAFVLLATTTPAKRAKAIEDYYACCRGEKPWPKWWQPHYRK